MPNPRGIGPGIGRVIGTRGLSFVPGRNVQREAPAGDIHGRVEFQERLVHRTKLLGTQIVVIDRATGLALLNERQRPDSGKQIVVGNVRRVLDRLGTFSCGAEQGDRARTPPQERPQGWQAQLRAALGTAQGVEHQR